MTATTDNGEIASLADSPLAAGNIDDYRDQAAASETSGGYGDTDDERAISALKAQLQSKPSGRGASDAELTEKAETLYAAICRQVQAGASGEQLEKFAALLGEKPAALRERLT